MNSSDTERYVRWQGYRIEQLATSINLFLAFGLASLAFVIDQILEAKHPQLNFEYPLFWWMASIMLGTSATVSRLLDFRYTARKIKDSSEGDGKLAKIFGKITWGAFWAQIITYLVGGWVFVTSAIS